MTVILVNRDVAASKSVEVNLTGFTASPGTYTALELSSLPGSETFESHTSNALKDHTIDVSGRSFEISLPPLSITAVLLKGETSDVVLSASARERQPIRLYPNPATSSFRIDYTSNESIPSEVVIYNITGEKYADFQWENSGKFPLTIATETFESGVYILEIKNKKFTSKRKLVLKKN